MKRIGVFGGSFDPIHYGHLILAAQVRELSGLDKVIFMPAYVNPFKVDSPPASGHDRLRMIELAIEGADGLEVSDLEISKEGPSYSVDTLNELHQKLGDDVKLVFLLGSDNLKRILDWKKSEELINDYGLIAVCRKGESRDEINRHADRIRSIYPNADIQLFETPELEISSSEIREKLRFGQDITFLTPDSVIDYIDQENIYDCLTRRLGLFVKANVKPSRYAHTLRVLKKCREYGEKYGADIEKLETAAIFHDAYRDAGNLEHGPMAAEHLEKDFGVTDPEILEAVRYHTTGHAGAKKTEMVLKLADTLEDGREFSEAAVLRDKMTDDLEESLLILMERLKVYVERVLDNRFNSDSQELLDQLRESVTRRDK
ncbi:MAG: nicotinate-nucleotide adenylyltransferase [Firmicutes bacterium]|nr:nicotinate-nucleotide adenylyltransferase [Bacillota bacterium]